MKYVDPSGMGGEEADVAVDTAPPETSTSESSFQSDNPVNQFDPELNPRGKNACYYLAIVRIAEIEEGRSLTVDQINEITTEMVKSGDLVMTYNGRTRLYHVNGRTEVLNAAFKKLGSTKRGKVSDDVDQITTTTGKADYTLISGTHEIFGTTYNHTQTGDGAGNVLYDPAISPPYRLEGVKYREVNIINE